MWVHRVGRVCYAGRGTDSFTETLELASQAFAPWAP